VRSENDLQEHIQKDSVSFVEMVYCSRGLLKLSRFAAAMDIGHQNINQRLGSPHWQTKLPEAGIRMKS
jgi:hypothetical protein